MVTCSCESGKELTTPCEHNYVGFELTTLDSGEADGTAWKIDYVPKAA